MAPQIERECCDAEAAQLFQEEVPFASVAPGLMEQQHGRAGSVAGRGVKLRSQEGAVIHDVEAVIARCLRLAKAGELVAIDGTVMQSAARSICLHGDTPGAVDLAREVRDALEGDGITIAANAPEIPKD